MVRSNRSLLGLAALLCSCAARSNADPSPRPSSPTGWAPPVRQKPDGVKALAAREAGFLRRFKVVSPGNRFKVQVRAVAPPSASAEGGSTVVEMPIGSGEPIRCRVFDEAIRPASAFAQLFKAASRAATVEHVEPWTVEVIKETPILFARLFYSAEGRHGPLVGELKAALHTTAPHPVLCYHDELGYEQTFLDEARAFSQSVTHAGEVAVVPTFTAIRIARENGASVGFECTTAERDRDPARVVTTSALMVPASPTELRFLDAEAARHVDASGRIVDGTWTVVIDGETKLRVDLARERERAYRYSGELDGNTVSGRFELRRKEHLTDDLFPLKALAEKVLDGRSFAIDFVSYAPLVDPTRPVHGRFYREATDPTFTVHRDIDGVSTIDTVDESGALKDGELQFGGTTLLLERVFFRGTPWGR
jgi:hypothetical protein